MGVERVHTTSMSEETPLSIRYARHPRIVLLRDILQYHLEAIALGFDRWREPHVHGPGLYVAVVVGPAIDSFADPMGENRWPAAQPRDVMAHDDGYFQALEEIAYTADGAVVVSVDGITSRQLVRFKSEDTETNVSYAPWMGARHMSALDISTRSDVVVALTLSQETGRVTSFEDGSFESIRLAELGTPYRSE